MEKEENAKLANSHLVKDETQPTESESGDIENPGNTTNQNLNVGINESSTIEAQENQQFLKEAPSISDKPNKKEIDELADQLNNLKIKVTSEVGSDFKNQNNQDNFSNTSNLDDDNNRNENNETKLEINKLNETENSQNDLLEKENSHNQQDENDNSGATKQIFKKPKLVKPRKILRRMPKAPEKNEPIECEVNLSLDEAKNGCTKTIEIERIFQGYGDRKICDKKEFPLSISPGIDKELRITVEGEGNKSLLDGKLQGDVIFIVRPTFKQISQYNIEYTAQLSSPPNDDGIYAIEIPTLDNVPIKLEIKADSVNEEFIETITGRGLPFSEYTDGKTHGDLLVRFEVLHPIRPITEINDKQNDQSSSGQVKKFELNLTLQEIFKGCTKQMEISRKRFDSDRVQYDDEKTFKIEIKPGTKGGTEILFPKEGDQLDDVTFVDIAIVVTDITETFERNGSDVIYNAKISNKQLVEKHEIEIPTLEGEMKKIQLDENFAQTLEKRFHGKGLPYPGDTRSRGNLFVKFEIVSEKEAFEFELKADKQTKEIEKKPNRLKNQTKVEIPNQLPPNHYPLALTVEEIYFGCVKHEKISRKITRNNFERTNEVTLDVQVQPGSIKGTQIELKQAGDREIDKISADVIFTVTVTEQSIFKIENFDLIYQAIITPDEALVGCNLKIPTIEHDIFDLQVEGHITANTEKTIPGLGVPVLNNDKGEHGNLLVRFNILSNAVKQDPPVERDLLISIEEIFSGTTKKRRLKKKVLDSNGNQKDESKILSIFVKPGTEEGTKITFPREGDQNYGFVPADIVFIVRDMPHALFTRNRANIEYNVKVTQNQLNLGKMFEIPLLECNEIVPCFADKSINETPEIHFKNRGLPLQENSNLRGDLVVRFEIIKEIEKKDADIRFDLNLTLENILHGFEKQVQINRKVVSESGEKIFYDQIVKIYVEPGTVAGKEYRQECLGDQRPGTIPADIVFVARDKPHAYFKREGVDIRYTTYVTHEETRDWIKFEIPTLNENKTLFWEPKMFTKYFNSKKFSGEGLPGKNGDLKRRGDLIACYEIVNNDRKAPIIKQNVPLRLEEILLGGVKQAEFTRTIIDPNGDRKEEKRIIPFDFQRGVPIRKGCFFSRIGNQQPGYAPGDLWIAFSVQPHETFKLFGANLQYTVKMTASEAAHAKFFQVPTLEKCFVSIKTERKITKNSIYELTGRGLPFYDYPYNRGKMIVKFEIAEDIVIETQQVNPNNIVETIDANIEKTRENSNSEKVDPIYVDLELTLDEVFRGGNKAVSFQRKTVDENGNVDYKTVNFFLQLKRGIEVGNEFVLKEKGHVYFGKQPADVIYVVKDVKYDHFTRNGANLEYTANITHDQSVNDCILQIPTLVNGNYVDLTFEQVNNKSVEILREYGLPFLDDPSKFGDIIVNFNIIDKNSSDDENQNENLSQVYSEEIKLEVTLEEIQTGTSRMEHLKLKKFRPDGKQVTTNRNVNVKIKPGAFSGQKIVLPREGSQRTRDSEAADVVFIIQEKPHALFTRNGSNLEYVANVNSSQVRPGSQISIPTLESENHLLLINGSFNIQTEFLIKGHGLPFYDEPNKKGDLVVRFKLNDGEFIPAKTENAPKDHIINKPTNKQNYALSLTLLEVLKGCIKKETIERIFVDSRGNKQTENKTFTIIIKPGTKTGHEYFFGQQGNQFGACEKPADVVFVVRDEPHEIFKRKGADLLCTEIISKEQAEKAKKGFKVTIPALDIKTGKLKKESKKEFNLNKTYRIKNKGLPYADKTNKRGNVLINFKIATDSSAISDFKPKF